MANPILWLRPDPNGGNPLLATCGSGGPGTNPVLVLGTDPPPCVCGGAVDMVVPGIPCQFIFCDPGDEAETVAMPLDFFSPGQSGIFEVGGFCYLFDSNNPVEDDGSYVIYDAGVEYDDCRDCCTREYPSCCDSGNAGYKPDPDSLSFVTIGFTAQMSRNLCCRDSDDNFRLVTATGTLTEEQTISVRSSGGSPTALCMNVLWGSTGPDGELFDVPYDGECCPENSPCEVLDTNLIAALDFDVSDCALYGTIGVGGAGFVQPAVLGVNGTWTASVSFGAVTQGPCAPYNSYEGTMDFYITWQNVAPCPNACASARAARSTRPDRTIIANAAVRPDQGIRNGITL